MASPFRNTLDGLRSFDHGLSVDEARRISGRHDVLNLAGNENTVGASPRVAEAVRAGAESAWIYPDSACRELTVAIARHLDVAPGRILCGTGSEALLGLITRATLDPSDRVILSSPTFPIYASLAVAAGATVIDVARRPDHRLDIDALARAMSQPAKLIFLCNPNNPTGTPIPSDDIARIAALVGSGGLVVVDEAYHEFHQIEYPRRTFEALDAAGSPWIVLRTFSKAYALGGFRVGYAVASEEAVVEVLDRIRPQFGVSSLGQRAALAALDDQAHLLRAVQEICSARAKLQEGLEELGFRVDASAANFLFVEAPSAMPEHLATQGIIVRPLGAGRLRLTVCRERDVPRVVAAFRSAQD